MPKEADSEEMASYLEQFKTLGSLFHKRSSFESGSEDVDEEVADEMERLKV
jgi:hypothetical protein